MKASTLLKYISLGSNLEYLRMVEIGTSVHGKNFILDNISTLIDIVEESEFTVAKQGTIILKQFKEKLNKNPEDHLLEKSEKEELYKIIEKLTFIVNAESTTKYAFFITEKRIDVNKLIFSIESLFAEGVFDWLPSGVQYDFKESGKCIAFGRPTASAFHVLRGLEGLIRYALRHLSPNTDTSEMNWGPVITHLKSLSITELNIVIDNLDRIRENYRNPTNHPEKIYNIEEAQDLFNLCVGVVNDIMDYLIHFLTFGE